jgi:hypothetical protein
MDKEVHMQFQYHGKMRKIFYHSATISMYKSRLGPVTRVALVLLKVPETEARSLEEMEQLLTGPPQ